MVWEGMGNRGVGCGGCGVCQRVGGGWSCTTWYAPVGPGIPSRHALLPDCLSKCPV